MILFCGDPHGQFAHIIEAVQAHRPKAVILLGDMQAQRPLHIELEPILAQTEIWFIQGNHDTDSDADHDHLFGSALADRNLHGRVVEIAGLRIAGLGGVFRGKVWTPPAPAKFESPEQYLARCGKGNFWRGGLPRTHRSTIFPYDYQRLQNQRADILVTHEAGSAHPHGFATIDELARSLGVSKTFHGHHHDQRDYSAESTRLGFDAFGVGFRGITDQDGRGVRAGEVCMVPVVEAVKKHQPDAAKAHLAAGRAIYYGDPQYPGKIVKEHPDGRRQLVGIDENSVVTVIREI